MFGNCKRRGYQAGIFGLQKGICKKCVAASTETMANRPRCESSEAAPSNDSMQKPSERAASLRLKHGLSEKKVKSVFERTGSNRESVLEQGAAENIRESSGTPSRSSEKLISKDYCLKYLAAFFLEQLEHDVERYICY